MSTLVRRIESWIFAPGDARRVAVLRIVLCSTLAIRLTRSIYEALSHQPAALYRPLSFMKFLHQMPSENVVHMLQSIGIAAAVSAAVGFRTRISLVMAMACALVLNGMTTSIGKVVHNDVMLMLAIVPLVASRCADVWSVDAWRHAHSKGARSSPAITAGPGYGWPVRVAMIVVAGAYFFTGWQKIINSGPAWFASGNLRWVLYASSDGQSSPNPFALALAGQAWLAHLVAFGTMVIETTFPVVLFKRSLARLYVPAVVGMHVGILLAMRLDYTAQIVTVVAVFTNWSWIADRLRVGQGLGLGHPGATMTT